MTQQLADLQHTSIGHDATEMVRNDVNAVLSRIQDFKIKGKGGALA